MKVGFIVDGQAEYGSLGFLTARIPVATGDTLGPIVYADLQPTSPVEMLVSRCREEIDNVFAVKGVTRTVVLLDLDDRPVGCVRDWAMEFQAVAQAGLGHLMPDGVYVVIKNACFENWLISDYEALKGMAKFNLSAAHEARIRSSADNVKAAEVIDASLRAAASANGRTYNYEKRSDSRAILSVARPGFMAENSRSFRRFLRVVGCTGYAETAQSKSIIPATDIPIVEASQARERTRLGRGRR